MYRLKSGTALAAVVLVLICGAAAAEDAGPSSSGDADSSYSDLAVFPIAFYTPETGMAFGAAGAYFFKPDPDARPSSLSGVAFYSQRGNLMIALSPELYSRDASRRILLGASYESFPQSFWGIGEETIGEMEEEYTSRAVHFEFLGQRRFLRGVRLGARYAFRYERVTDVEEDGILARGDVPGTEEHVTSGLGVVATWDRRDNIFFAKKGAFVEALGMYYGDLLGSDYEFSRVSFDARAFLPVVGEHSLALRGLATSVAGQVPFQELPGLGGPFLMRGYEERRFRDEVRMVFQAEYRSAYWWRVGFAAFGSYGDVAPRLRDLDIGSFKYAAGAGVRIRLNDENFNLRVDAGVGEDSQGFYIIAGDAF